MIGPSSTAARIDAFETRFTTANGAHFLIAPNGKEAWPLSDAEFRDFRALFRRRMVRARWIRRGALIAILPLLHLFAWLADVPPGRMGPGWNAAYAFVLIGLPILAFLQHSLTADLTERAISRPLKRRITTRHPPAIAAPVGPLGRYGKWLLIAAIAFEIAIQLYHAIAGQAEYAAYMRVLYRLEAGNESWAAMLTAHLSRIMLVAGFGGWVMMTIDRKRREAAAASDAAP